MTRNRHIDIFFLLLIIEIFTITTLLILNVKEITFTDYVLYMLIFLIIVISFYSNLITGLITSAFLVFGYGSYMLYQSLFYEKSSIGNSYFWIVLFPLSAFISGRLSDSINEIRNKNMKFEKQVKELVTVDEITGFNNIKEFYKDLNEEMSRSKRHKFSLVVMLVEIQYLEELIGIYGTDKINKIFKIISNIIEKVTRTEDKRYKIDEDLFAVIMPNTDIKGAEIVKERLKKKLEDIEVNHGSQTKTYKFDFKIAVLQYNDRITNSFEFKELVQKELEYDI
ncbi:GGDEF domain-containing protein [Paramaledivibacter caminithermalis]|jgi:diguanylate cyclase (GGDEF)-like protein|uniref:Diguanylate cyclase (GGDEF) domain-containing protein n=1 Tax=Paramaledivibacter caminithermalis (strain DSM 15212 / CIP 107654 / DViRD3) TaxID=1121301 RepID=A0A1M6PC53_PARC5|nr:diguanylate cyclase [Paramaledivibacter caminithermalis]SHK05514.1 diguanylate cyclase (GGDEF) domain-containing protein [Paramaledivibacter caminithermalis DSM 15212]